MKCAMSLFTILVILTFVLPTDIGCSCSKNINDIIILMSQDADYRKNPCYIEWQADQDKKILELWQQTAEFENSAVRNHKIELKNHQIEQEKLRNSYRRTTVEEKKLLSVEVKTAIVIGIGIAICCACALCFSLMRKVNNSIAIINALETNLNPGEMTVIATTPELATSAFRDRRTIDLSLGNNANADLTANSVDAQSSPSSLPRGRINRQSSLPSYEDAVKMQSAPLME